MSVPYGQPPATPQPGSTKSPLGDLGLGKLLALASGGLGLIVYFLTFADDVGGYLRTSLLGFLLVGGGLLAASSVLPKAPVTLVPATVLVFTGTLFLLIDVAKGPIFLPQGETSTPGLVILVLVLAVLESAAAATAVFAEAGMVKMPQRTASFPQQSWPPQQPGGAYYGGPGQGGYPGQPPIGGSFGGPGVGGPAGPGAGGPGVGGPGVGGPGGPGGPGAGGPGAGGPVGPGAGFGGSGFGGSGFGGSGPGGGFGGSAPGPGGGYSPQQAYGPPTVQYYPQQPGGGGYQPGQQDQGSPAGPVPGGPSEQRPSDQRPSDQRPSEQRPSEQRPSEQQDQAETGQKPDAGQQDPTQQYRPPGGPPNGFGPSGQS